MRPVVGRTAALHIAFWQYDPWYRRAWFVGPQAIAFLLASWLLADKGVLPTGKWAKPSDCSNASSPGCAATQRVMFSWVDEVSHPTIANQVTVTVDRSAFRSSAAADQTKLSAALGAYYRRNWTRAVDILKSANPSDPNVQYVTALALLIPSTTDQVRDAQALLRSAAASGQRQANGVLGRTLIMGVGGLPKDQPAGRKLIEDGAAAGDTYAMRLAAAGYVNREFDGTYDSVKAVDLLRKAADAGEPLAMAQFAYSIKTGRGGLARDESKVLDYLRRSAEAGYLEAQFTLGRWATERYETHETEDPSEGVKWYERAYQHSYSSSSLVNLARLHRFAHSAPWFDTKRSFELLQLCAPYSYNFCHYWLGRAYQDGAGTPRDLVKAYAYHTVAKQLGRPESAGELQRLDSFLQPADKTRATELAASIQASLRPVPAAIMLQSREAESAGPSPWTAPSAQPAAPSAPPSAPVSPPSQQSAGDWDTCKGNNLEPAIAACARLIASGITGQDLGMAHFYQGWNYNEKKQYREAVAQYDKAIELGANPAPAHNNRGIAYQALDNLDAALRNYDEAIRIDSSYALGYENRAYAYLIRNRLDDAMSDANEAIRLNAKRARAYWVRAGIYEARAQWNDVVSDCRMAIELNSKYEDCFNRRGWAYYKLRRYEVALADFDEAVRLAPEWTTPLDNRGAVYEALGNFDAAFRDYSKAASLGNADGMNNVGALYAKGKGVAKDPLAARRWYEKAADKGHAWGMANLGWMYLNGQGGAKDYAGAKYWYEKAAALGNAWAMTELGVMYHNGNGVPQNYSEAFRWYEKAAAQGEPWALFNLGVMYEQGQGVGRSRSEAINWYQKAAAAGHPDANRKLQALTR